MTDPKVFPHKIFDKALFTDANKKEYMTFVKDEEDWSLGKLNKGLFHPQQGFKIVVIS